MGSFSKKFRKDEAFHLWLLFIDVVKERKGNSCVGNPGKDKVKSSQITFICIALLTIQILTKQLHNIKFKYQV